MGHALLWLEDACSHVDAMIVSSTHALHHVDGIVVASTHTRSDSVSIRRVHPLHHVDTMIPYHSTSPWDMLSSG